MKATQNNQRVSARITHKVYKTIIQAAELSGSTLNQFVVQSAYEKAQSVIENEKFIKLSSRSASVFFKDLDDPPKPNVKLKKAARKYKDIKDALEN